MCRIRPTTSKAPPRRLCLAVRFGLTTGVSRLPRKPSVVAHRREQDGVVHLPVGLLSEECGQVLEVNRPSLERGPHSRRQRGRDPEFRSLVMARRSNACPSIATRRSVGVQPSVDRTRASRGCLASLFASRAKSAAGSRLTDEQAASWQIECSASEIPRNVSSPSGSGPSTGTTESSSSLSTLSVRAGVGECLLRPVRKPEKRDPIDAERATHSFHVGNVLARSVEDAPRSDRRAAPRSRCRAATPERRRVASAAVVVGRHVVAGKQ